MTEPKKLNRVVIKEEYVALTGDFKLAIVLNQMVYWAERRKDADLFIKEEKERYQKYSIGSEIENMPTMEETHGWIYKKAEDLADETMIGVSGKTMLSYLNTLVERGWLQRRKNPYIEMDRTYQYRVDLVKIQNDLFELGYSLEGYDLGITNLQNVNSKLQDVNTNLQNENSQESVSDDASQTPEGRNLQNVNRIAENASRIGKNVSPSGKNVRAIPETTTETKKEINTNNHDDKKGSSKVTLEESISFGKYTGIDMSPRARQNLYTKWRNDFSQEMVFKAGQIMLLYAVTGSMEYIDRVLQNWKSKNIRTVDQVEKEYKGRTKSTKTWNNSDDYEIYVPGQRV